LEWVTTSVKSANFWDGGKNATLWEVLRTAGWLDKRREKKKEARERGNTHYAVVGGGLEKQKQKKRNKGRQNVKNNGLQENERVRARTASWEREVKRKRGGKGEKTGVGFFSMVRKLQVDSTTYDASLAK